MEDPAAAPLPAHARYRCRGCGFDLSGLTPSEGRLRCPECGSDGGIAEVAEPEPPPLPRMLDTVWRMCRWSTGLIVIAVGMTIAGGLGDLDYLKKLGVLALLGAFMTGPSVSLLIAADVASTHARERGRYRRFAALILAGLAANAIQCIAALSVMVTLSTE